MDAGGRKSAKGFPTDAPQDNRNRLPREPNQRYSGTPSGRSENTLAESSLLVRALRRKQIKPCLLSRCLDSYCIDQKISVFRGGLETSDPRLRKSASDCRRPKANTCSVTASENRSSREQTCRLRTLTQCEGAERKTDERPNSA